LLGIQRPQDGLDEETIAELVFTADTKPTLRQAMIAVMASDATGAWRVADIASGIIREKWLSDTEEAAKRVSDMASVMVGDGLLVRVDRGTYGLDAELVARLELLKANPFMAGVELARPRMT
jgi:hypothetical protein